MAVILNAFRNYNKKFLAVARPNEPVLVVTKRYRSRGMGGSGYEALDIHRCMGVLPSQKPFSKLGKDVVTIFVPRHVYVSGLGEIKLKTEPMAVHWWHTHHQDPDVPIYSSRHSEGCFHTYIEADEQKRLEEAGLKKKDYPFEVVVGHRAIQEYLLERHESHFYLGAIHMLELSNIELLPKTKEVLDQTREEILNQLVNLSDKEALIKASMQQKRGDKESIKWHTRNCMRDIREVREKMRPILTKAVAFAMDKTPCVKTFADKPGFSIDVPVYIRGLNERLQQKPEKVSA